MLGKRRCKMTEMKTWILKGNTALLSAGIILFAVLFSTSLFAAEKLITIVHTNDMHSHFQGFAPEIDYQPFHINADQTRGGWARVATVIKRTRNERNNPVLVVDAGDFTMGSLFHMLNREEAFELRLLTALGYDAVTLGNHEFDLKPAGLAATLKTAKIKNGLPQIVLANAIFDRSKPALSVLENAFAEAGVKPYIVLQRDGMKIAIFGLLGKDAAEVSPFAKPLIFRDPAEAAKEIVDILRNREKVDMIICLSHGGLRDNPKKSEDVVLAQKVPGINVIISGHTHTKLDRPMIVGDTLIVQAWCYGRQVGVLDVVLKDGKVGLKNYEPVAVTSAITGDKAVQSIIDSFKKTADSHLFGGTDLAYDKIIAETKHDLTIGAEESPLGNLLADAIRWTVNQADGNNRDPVDRVVVAVESNGVIRDNLVAGRTGKITVGDLFRTIPLGIGQDDTMGYPLISFYLYGYEIKRAAEILTSVRPLKNDDYYLQISGLRFTYNPHRVIFDRVTAMEIGSEEEGFTPLDYSQSNKKLYRVAANIYNATFLKLVGKFTFSMLDIVPKNKEGVPIEKLSAALIDGDKLQPGVQELKQWKGVIQYVRSFPDRDGNGVPDIPEKYQGKLGRIVEKPSINPVNLIKRPSTPTMLVLAITGLVAVLIAAVAVIAVKRKRKKG